MSPRIYTYPWQYSVYAGLLLELKHTHTVCLTNGSCAGPSAVKQAASGSGIGSSAAGKPPQGNAWLLSRSVPVDVRLLAAGAASLGALYYYSSRSATIYGLFQLLNTDEMSQRARKAVSCITRICMAS